MANRLSRQLNDHIARLEQLLDDTKKELVYYKAVAKNTGVLRLRETETLSNLLIERTRLDEELQRHRDHLEELVETRTAELSNAMAEAQQLNVQLQQEILERRRVEEAIRESEERFRVLAHNSPDVIMRFDRAFRHLYVNPVVVEQTGIPHLEFIGKAHEDLGFPAHLIRIWEEAIQEVFDSQDSHRIEFQLPNGTWIDWLLFPEFSLSGEVSAVLATARDITPYKSIEEALRQQIIERRRSEEKQRLLETQLRETQKHEALGQLAGGIAHDFNNILSIMMGHIEVLIEDSPEENSRVSLDYVWRAGERAAELIRQISLFTSVQEHQLESIDMSQVIQETLSLIRATIPTSIEIRSHIQPDLSPILADASQVQQVIVNLCVNAKHAMRENGGFLDVSLEESTYGYELAQKLGLIAGTYLKLTISDTGQGMSTHVQEHIFEPFFTTKNVGEGSGLGLAVVHGIVTGHGGTISVESDVGREPLSQCISQWQKRVLYSLCPRENWLTPDRVKVIFSSLTMKLIWSNCTN